MLVDPKQIQVYTLKELVAREIFKIQSQFDPPPDKVSSKADLECKKYTFYSKQLDGVCSNLLDSNSLGNS